MTATSVWWCPTPRYILRKHCILRLLRGLPAGRVLEIGCAQGDMLRTLGRRGFSGLGVDLSADAVREAQRTLAGLEGRMRAALAGQEKGTGPYDYVMAFEVLEHIRDDPAALAEWRGFVAPGSRLLLSVPADPRRWDASDESVGHYRRYTRQGLEELLRATGFRIERLWAYGFPVVNVAAVLENRSARRRVAEYRGASCEARSALSGLDRSRLKAWQWLWRNPLFNVFCVLQMAFVNTDWGNGYVVRARAV